MSALRKLGVRLSDALYPSPQLPQSVTEVYERCRQLPATPRGQMLGPFGCKLTIGQGVGDREAQRYAMQLFDVAGEDLAAIANIAEQAQFVAFSRGLIVLVDPVEFLPTQFDTGPVADRLRLDAGRGIRKGIRAIAETLTEIWEVPSPLDLEIPLCFVLAKADAVEWTGEFDWSGQTDAVVAGAGDGDTRAALLASSEVTRDAFEQLGGELVIDEVEETFNPEFIRWSAASATSTMPTLGQGPAERDWVDEPQPCGVALSVLQILDAAGEVPQLASAQRCLMGAPKVSPGLVEQAVFTWSKHNLGGGRGLGVGEVSAGLRSHVAWLGSLDLNSLRPFDDSLGSETDGYEGWEEMAAVGSFPAAGLTVVYRTIASAGLDGAGRNRFLVHLLVGRAGELDLGRVGDDDPHWLRAEQCPLNELPKLATLELNELIPRVVSHECAGFDDDVQKLLRRLISTPDGLTSKEAPGSSQLTAKLLAAIPTELWGQIRLGWSVGSEGPVAKLGSLGAGEVDTAERSGVAGVGLDECAFHSRVDRIWAEIPAGERSWPVFTRVISSNGSPVGKPKIATEVWKTRSEPLAASRQRAALAIAEAIGVERWDVSGTLHDWGAQQALGALERTDRPTEGWLSVLDEKELQALFSGIESNAGFARALRFLKQPETPPELLIARWRETSLAVLGLAALGSGVDRISVGAWAVPRRPNDTELAKLVGYLRRSERGLDQLASLLNGGFASTAEGRGRIVRALLAAGATPRELFGSVLERAELPARVQLEFIRENVDLAAEWLGVPERWRETFRLGFISRRWFPLPFFRSQSD